MWRRTGTRTPTRTAWRPPPGSNPDRPPDPDPRPSRRRPPPPLPRRATGTWGSAAETWISPSGTEICSASSDPCLSQQARRAPSSSPSVSRSRRGASTRGRCRWDERFIGRIWPFRKSSSAEIIAPQDFLVFYLEKWPSQPSRGLARLLRPPARSGDAAAPWRAAGHGRGRRLRQAWPPRPPSSRPSSSVAAGSGGPCRAWATAATCSLGGASRCPSTSTVPSSAPGTTTSTPSSTPHRRPGGRVARSPPGGDTRARRLPSEGTRDSVVVELQVLDKESFQKQMLEKLIWISLFMLVGARHPGAAVGVVEKEHRSEVESLIAELAAAEKGMTFEEGIEERLCAYSRAVEHFPTAVKVVHCTRPIGITTSPNSLPCSLPMGGCGTTRLCPFKWRNGWFYSLTQKALEEGKPDPCPLHSAWLKELNVI